MTTSTNPATVGQLELPLPQVTDWQEYALWVESNTDPRAFKQDGLIYALAGLATEGGECGAFVEKFLRKNGEYNVSNMDVVLELGDVFYYLTLACKQIGCDLETLMKTNKEKLIDRKLNGKK